MEMSIVNSPSVSSSNPALLVALELSKATWVIALRGCEFLPVAVSAEI
jgi:hypothetical protein